MQAHQLNFATVAPRPAASPEAMAFLNRLRFHATRCRASARLDIATACTLIDPQGDETAAASVFVRVLGQALDRPPVWYRPGETDLSFDERWVLAVAESYAAGDGDSFTFLTQRRISGPKRRLFLALIARLCEGSF